MKTKELINLNIDNIDEIEYKINSITDLYNDLRGKTNLVSCFNKGHLTNDKEDIEKTFIFLKQLEDLSKSLYYEVGEVLRK